MTKKNRFELVSIGLNRLNLDGVMDDFNGLSLFLSTDDRDKEISLCFNSYVTYRNSDESERIKFLSDNLELPLDGVLLKSSNTDYIDWILKESQSTLDPKGLRHYIIITPNDIFEVLSFDEPQVSEIAKDQKHLLNLGRR